MTLNGRNAPLAEINKNSGAHQKNFNEDRLSAVKCRPVIVVSRNIRYMWICIAYYRAMLRKARLWDCMSSVRLRDFHTGWNTSKIIARPRSLGSLLSLTPTAVWCNGNTPTFNLKVVLQSSMLGLGCSEEIGYLWTIGSTYVADALFLCGSWASCWAT